MNLNNLQPGQTIDLGGAHVTLTQPVHVPPGVCVVKNGSISYQGNAGVVGSGGMACFVTDMHSGQLTLQGLHFDIPPKVAISSMFNGGKVICNGLSQTNGALGMHEGGDSFTFTNCSSIGVPDKYWLANFTNTLKVLRGDNSVCPAKIRQGMNEACVRLMQVDDSIITGLKVQGSGCKQAVQDRPGGKPGTIYKQHVWRQCQISGGVDLGNFKDPTDVNYPFGRLLKSEWDDCQVDHFSKTFNGDPNGPFGIQTLIGVK